MMRSKVQFSLAAPLPTIKHFLYILRGADRTIKTSKGNPPELSFKYTFYIGSSSKKEENKFGIKN